MIRIKGASVFLAKEHGIGVRHEYGLSSGDQRTPPETRPLEDGTVSNM